MRKDTGRDRIKKGSDKDKHNKREIRLAWDKNTKRGNRKRRGKLIH
jgi:hypothetical protein